MERNIDIYETIGKYIDTDGNTPDDTVLLYDIAESLRWIKGYLTGFAKAVMEKSDEEI